MAADTTVVQQLLLLLEPAHFETLVNDLMSSDDDQRSAAVSLFNRLGRIQPDSFLLRLTHLLSSLLLPSMSAVLLRKHLTSSANSSFLYPKVTESTRAAIKTALLSSLQQETVKSIVKKINDTISELASSILPQNGWPELLPFMFQCVTPSTNANLQESALLIFSQLALVNTETLIPHLNTLHTVFKSCLQHATSADVWIAAFHASINFVFVLSDNRERDRFQDLLPLMTQTLAKTLNENQEATAQEALELLIKLAGTEPRFFRKQIGDIVGSMLEIAEAAGRLEEGTRHLAVKFMMTLAEERKRAPGMVRKLGPVFVKKLFEVLMGMLLDIEDVIIWYEVDNEDNKDAGESSNYVFGQRCLDRLAISLGCSRCFRIQPFLQSSEACCSGSGSNC